VRAFIRPRWTDRTNFAGKDPNSNIARLFLFLLIESSDASTQCKDEHVPAPNVFSLTWRGLDLMNRGLVKYERPGK
jgi:hypothetical protein